MTSGDKHDGAHDLDPVEGQALADRLCGSENTRNRCTGTPSSAIDAIEAGVFVSAR